MPMDRELIIEKFQNIRIWRRGDERAPHKPLLILYAIGKLQRDGVRLIPYTEIDEGLGRLLQEFGRSQSTRGTEYPFWRLQGDSVWEVTNAENITPNSSGDARKIDLLENNVSGGFHEDIVEQLQSDSTLSVEIVQMMLNKHFPPSIHSEILQTIDFEFPPQVFETRGRSFNFRNSVLRAYEYQCAVCGFEVRLGATPIALEASHIKWQSHSGPSKEVNGLCLCVMHHKLFDLGAFTLSKELHILVSDDVRGTKGFDEWLMDFHGEKITPPQKQIYFPDLEFIGWHVREVFKGDYREL
ncbi:MAG: HNH endonuclease [Candidatus Poribacteria bacterium]|nr:HNH endonuclease [Candidatus Poribacteria bacterium]